jgi:paraquat-inducible protein B
MADTPQLPDIPEAIAVGKSRWSLSLVWVIPLVAAIIGGWLAVKTVMERGPTITINFKTAEGLEAGTTKIKYKNVDIGEVKTITLSEDRSRVVVTAQFTKQAESVLVDDTRFWVVRPRVAGGSVSGLGTLLSGSYIGVDVGKSATAQRDFIGLEVPPVFTADAPGRQYVLKSDTLGSLDIGAPIYFRRLQVGRVTSYDLDKDGNGVTFKIFINSPYDQYVDPNTRFWHASGLDVTLDANGVKVNTEGLVAIVLGGIAFQSPDDGVVLPPAAPNTTFNLFPNRAKAMKNPDTSVENYVMVFKGSVRGLTIGAPLDFRGVVIGEVTAINIDFDPVKKDILMAVSANLYPERLSSRYRKPTAKPASQKEMLDRFVERGFRAQLKTGSLLTGQLYVALDFFPKAAKAKIDWTKNPPELPTQPGSLEELQVTLSNLAQKLDKVDVDGIAAGVQQTLTGVQETLKHADSLIQRLDAEIAPEARATLEETRRTLTTVERALATDAPLQQNANDAMREVGRAAQAVRILVDYLERHPEALICGKKEDGK